MPQNRKVTLFNEPVIIKDHVTGLEAEQLDDIRVDLSSGAISATRADLLTAAVFTGVPVDELAQRPFTAEDADVLERLVAPFGALLRRRAVSTLKRSASLATPEQIAEARAELMRQVEALDEAAAGATSGN